MNILGAAVQKRFDTLGWGLFSIAFLGSAGLALFTVFVGFGPPSGRVALSLMDHPLHFVLEMASILVCLTIFLIAVFSYPFLPNAKLLAAGYTFFATGFLDTIHLLGDNDITLFPFPEQLEIRSAVFQIVSRLMLSLGLIFIVRIAENRKRRVPMLGWFVFECAILLAVILLLVWNPLQVAWLRPDGNAIWLIRVLQFFTAAFLFIGSFLTLQRYFFSRDRLYLQLAAALVILLGSEAIASNVPPHSLHGDGLAHLLRFLAQLLLFDVFYVNGIRRPYLMLSDARDSLNHYVNELDKEVEDRTLKLTQANDRLMADMEMARDVQRSMLPVSLPHGDFLRFTAGYVPAEQLSGDFYDVFKLDASRYGICVGDVAGHGVSAAMLTVFAFQSLQSLREDSPVSGMNIPAFVVKHLYESFNAANFRDELYLVMFYCVYNVETGILSWTSGGLNTVPVRLRPDGTLQLLDSDGVAICKMGDFIKPQYQNRQMLLFPGDKLILYTDGLVEARSPMGKPYSQERLHDLLKEGAKLEAEALKDFILKDVHAYTGLDAPGDDITLLIMEVALPF